MMQPIETTAPLEDGVAAGTHGVLVRPGVIFIDGEGVFMTEAYRELADWEVQQLTHVFPHLFLDMEEAYWREMRGGE